MKKPVLIILAIMLILAGSVIANAQNEAKSSWFDSFLGFFKSLFSKIFHIESKEPIIIVNNSENTTEKNQEATEEINQEDLIPNVTGVLNITCGYCQYLVNDTCLNYSCCGNSQCNKNESCIKNECISVNCSSCQYAENHTCVDYECCKDEDCAVTQKCADHMCTNYNYECYKDEDCSTNQVCFDHKCLNRDCPTESCEDYDHCTLDYCNPSTSRCRNDDIFPCCGDARCQIPLGENESNCLADCNNTYKFLYCENDLDCVPCCTYHLWGECVNKNYTCWDVQSLFNPRYCDSTYEGPIRCEIECNKCVDNQCVTTYLNGCVESPYIS